MKFKTRIKEIRELRGLTQKGLAEKAATTPETISRLETDKRQVDINWLKRIGAALGVSPQELMHADEITIPHRAQSIHRFQPEGESFHLSSAIIGDNKDSILSFGPNDVPIYGSASGSTDSVILNFDQILGYAMRHPNQQGLKNGFALYARGSSMSPRYEPGELVYVVANKPPQRDVDCIIELNNGEGFIKIFVKQTAKEVICRQLNPAKEWKRSISDIKALHAVVGRG